MARFNFYRPSNGVYGHENGAYLNSAPVQIVDDFEDSDIGEYSGDTTEYTVSTATVHDGTYSLEKTSTSWGGLVSTTGLSTYPQAGDTVRLWCYYDGAEIFQFITAAQSETVKPNGYWFGHDFVNSKMNVRKDGTTVNSVSQSFSTGTWYEMEIVWQTDGTITHNLYDSTGTKLNSVSMTDTTYTSGGIGWHNGQNTAHFDNIRIV